MPPETVQRLQCAWQRHLAGFRELLLASRKRCPLLGQGKRQTPQPGEREGSHRAARCRETPGSAPATVLRQAGVVQWSSYRLLFAGILALSVTEMGFSHTGRTLPALQPPSNPPLWTEQKRIRGCILNVSKILVVIHSARENKTNSNTTVFVNNVLSQVTLEPMEAHILDEDLLVWLGNAPL